MASAWDDTPAPGSRAVPRAAASAAGAASASPQPGSAWDTTSTEPAATTPPRSALENTGDFMTAVGHHVMKPLHGAAQLVENGAAKLFSLAPDNPVSRAVTSTAADDNKALNDWEAAYQQSTPNSPGAYAGATLGTIAPMLVGGVGSGLKTAGEAVASRVAPMLPKWLAPVGAKVAAGATQGAIMGAASPVTSAPLSLEDLIAPRAPEPGFWEQKADQVGLGAAFGGAVPVATTAAGAAINAGKGVIAGTQAVTNPTKYAARQLAAQLGADAPTVAADLKSAPQYVPNSIPTAAQAGATPRLVQVEKALANSNDKFKAKLAERENANNAARLQVVSDVAQTPQALEAAIATRNASTAPMRDFTVTNGNPVPVAGVTGALSSLENGALGVRPTIGGAAGSMRSAVDDFTNVTPPNTLTNVPGSATAPPAMLDALRQNANDYLSKYSPQGFVGTQEQAAMTPIKGAIVKAINDANPGHKLSRGGWGQGLEQAGPEAPSYRDYLTQFAKQSVPVNTMQVGQQLQEALGGKVFNSDGDVAATLTNYRGALAKALKGSDYGIDPQAQAALEAVQSDLQRATISNSIRTAGGSDTAYNQGAGSSFLKALGAGDDGNGKAALAAAATLAATGSAKAAGGAAFGAKKASGWVANRVGDALGELMLDPQRLAEMLTQGSPALQASAPSAFGQLTRRSIPAINAAIAAELLKSQAPQVIATDRQKAKAYQP